MIFKGHPSVCRQSGVWGWADVQQRGMVVVEGQTDTEEQMRKPRPEGGELEKRGLIFTLCRICINSARR